MFTYDVSVTSMVVHDLVLFAPGGDIRDWANTVERKLTGHARRLAPTGASTGRVNKSRANAGYPVGSLKGSISGSVSMVGPRQLQTIVEVDVPYAVYVIKGTAGATKGMIFGKRARDERGRFVPIGPGSGMYLPSNPGWGKAIFKQRVRGQRANPFLDLAFAATAAQHPSLRG